MVDVEFYETRKGEQPAKTFLLSLEKRLRAKVSDMILLLQENGYKLREPYVKYISDGIFELRIQLGTNAVRVMYFFYSDQRIVLTNGFLKKTKKMLWNEFFKAKRYKNDYLNRKGYTDEHKV